MSSSVASWIFQPGRLNFPLQALPVSGLDGEDVVIPVAGKGQVRGWLLLPKDVESSDDSYDERTVGCWSDVAVLYLHGVSGNRGKFKRVESYRRLLDIGCTVLAIDYRYCTYIIKFQTHRYRFFFNFLPPLPLLWANRPYNQKSQNA